MATRKRKLKRDWEDVAREAQEYRDVSIGKVPGITPILDRLERLESAPRCSIDVLDKVLEPKDSQVTQCLPEDLLTMLGRGEISAVEVTTAFLRRASVSQKLVSSL